MPTTNDDWRAYHLTPLQAELYTLIRNEPGLSIREMAEHLGVTYAAIYERMLALERKGAITKEPGKSRTIRATPIVGWCS